MTNDVAGLPGVNATLDNVGVAVNFMLTGPAFVGVLCLCLCVICIFRLAHIWPNRVVWLPVIIVGPAFYTLMESPNATLLRNPYLILFIIGFFLSVASLVIYSLVMIKTGLERRLFGILLNGNSDTTHIKKEDVEK